MRYQLSEKMFHLRNIGKKKVKDHPRVDQREAESALSRSTNKYTKKSTAHFCNALFCTTKTTKGTTRIPEISHLRAGNHGESMEKKKQHRSTSRSMITTPQECTGEHPRPVSSLLKGLIRRKNNEKTNLSNAATENKLANRHHA